MDRQDLLSADVTRPLERGFYFLRDITLPIKAAIITAAFLAVFFQDLVIIGSNALPSDYFNYVLAIPFICLYRGAGSKEDAALLYSYTQINQTGSLSQTQSIYVVVLVYPTIHAPEALLVQYPQIFGQKGATVFVDQDEQILANAPVF